MGTSRTSAPRFPTSTTTFTTYSSTADQAVARLTYTGTHRGTVLGHAPTGNRIEYQGIAWFKVRNHRIVEGFVLGDVDTLRAQLEANAADPPGATWP